MLVLITQTLDGFIRLKCEPLGHDSAVKIQNDYCLMVQLPEALTETKNFYSILTDTA